jgi:DNA-binding MarR family transcriptional regulator
VGCDLEPWPTFLRAYSAALRAIEADVRRRGAVPLSWYDVLLEINASDGRRLRMQDVAARVVLSRTRVSRLVDEMVAAGLVRKDHDDGDRRAVWAAITDAGREALRQTAPVYLDGIERHFLAYLDEPERAYVRAALAKIVDAHDG